MDEQTMLAEQVIFEQDVSEGTLAQTLQHYVPSSWAVELLGNICSITTGKKDVDEGSPEGEYPFFSCSQKIYKSHTYSFDAEAILIAGNGDVGNTKYYRGKFEAYQRTYVLTDFRVYAPYLYLYLLGNIKSELIKKKSGSTMPYIRKGDLANFAVAIPPLREQRAIARILNTVQDTIQARRRELELERERKAVLMQHLFTKGTHGEPTVTTRFGDVPQSWPIVPLEECAYVQTGITKGRNLEGRRVVSLPYLRVANVQDGYLDLSEIKQIDLADDEVEQYLLKPGDVLLTEGGDFDKLGRGFIWHGQVPRCVHQNHIFAVRSFPDRLLSEFLAYLIQSPYGKAYFLSVAHRTTHLASINSTKLKALPTLLPPLQEQQAIVSALEACDAKITALSSEVTLEEDLFRALLEELMTGRLSVAPLVEAEVLA